MASVKFQNNKIEWEMEVPPQCPLCHYLVPMISSGVPRMVHYDISVVFYCGNPDCARPFIALYTLAGRAPRTNLKYVTPSNPTPPDRSEIVAQISPQFMSIFAEATQAKDSGLVQICGPGFRKAFEFLIKDYARSIHPESAADIIKAPAGQVVGKYIDDPRIQAVARRTLWLGNDETHYLREWVDKDVSDLITLIRLTIDWIEIGHLSNQYIDSMPEN